MTPAYQARNAAISLEAKKDGLVQKQSGDWKMSFTVQAIDMSERLTKAPMGTRFAMVLVEIGDDELPVSAAATPPAADARPEPKDKPARAKREWRDMLPSQQAGIRCEEAAFTHFLREQWPDDWRETQDTADCVRLVCGVESRADLNMNQKARVIWHQLDEQYQAWKLMESIS